jgi:hypothetical protein
LVCQALLQDAGANNALVGSLWSLIAALNSVALFVTDRVRQIAQLSALTL